MIKSDYKSKLFDQAKCTLCNNIFDNPQLIKCCKVNFCLKCIHHHFYVDNNSNCPNCKSEATLDDLLPNKALEEVSKWIENKLLIGGKHV